MTAGHSIRILTAAAALAAVGTVQAAQTNSSFETGDFTGWNAQGAGWSVTDKGASDGRKSAQCAVARDEAPNVKACAKVISNAKPGFLIRVNLDVAGKNKHKSSSAKISVICVDKAGAILAEQEKKISAPQTEFGRVTVPELLVPSGTAEAYLMLMVEVATPARSAEWWRFDRVDISVD
ncbi:hypothetical protein [Pontiella sp.]|uniref:hypothetical protein n=1 Tax=Pontiella sp. TaxID=2837462 RepID=UPI0035692892